MQQLSLRNPTIRAKLGLPDKNTSATASDSQELIAPETTPANSPEGQKVPAEKLSPKQLVAVSPANKSCKIHLGSGMLFSQFDYCHC